jgi:hypothetical protein
MNVKTEDAAKLAGLTYRHACQLVERGAVVPLPGGAWYRFGVCGVLAMALWPHCRRAGYGTQLCDRVARWVSLRTLDDLLDQFDRGERVLLIVGDGAPFPRLLAASTVFENPGIDIAAAMRAGVPVLALDIKAAYEQLQTQLATSRRAKAAQEPQEAVA